MLSRKSSNILFLSETDGCGAPGGGILPTSSAPITRRQISMFLTNGCSWVNEVRLMPAVWVSGPWQEEQFCSNKAPSSCASSDICPSTAPVNKERKQRVRDWNTLWILIFTRIAMFRVCLLNFLNRIKNHRNPGLKNFLDDF